MLTHTAMYLCTASCTDGLGADWGAMGQTSQGSLMRTSTGTRRSRLRLQRERLPQGLPGTRDRQRGRCLAALLRDPSPTPLRPRKRLELLSWPLRLWPSPLWLTTQGSEARPHHVSPTAEGLCGTHECVGAGSWHAWLRVCHVGSRTVLDMW